MRSPNSSHSCCSSCSYLAKWRGSRRTRTSRHSSIGNARKRTRASRSGSSSDPVTALASPFLPWNPRRVDKIMSRPGVNRMAAHRDFWIASLPLAAHKTCSMRAPPALHAHVGQQPFAALDLQLRDRVVGSERHHRRERIRGSDSDRATACTATLAATNAPDCGPDWRPGRPRRNRRVCGLRASSGSTLALGEHRQRRRVGSQALRFRATQATPHFIRLRFPGMFDRGGQCGFIHTFKSGR